MGAEGAIWRSSWGRVAAALVVGVLLPSTARAAVTRHLTPAGAALARSTLLRGGDLGKGWTGGPVPRSVPQLTCRGFSPPVRGATEIGGVASPTFRESQAGPFVAQDAYAYATAAQQARVWRAVVRPALLRCVAESLSGGGAQGVRFTVTGKRLLPLPSLPVPVARYRVSGTATSQGQSVDVFLDMLVLGWGRTIATVSISSFEQPAATKLELRLARAVVRRMEGG